MKLVEAEAEGPIEGEEAVVTAPRPPHRRVSVSFLFTLTVLIGTVVAIYMTFPARNNVLMTEAIDRHRDAGPAWDLTNPTAAELRAWSIGVVGKNAPLPPADSKIIGARQIEVLDRRAAIVQLEVGGEPVTYLVQHARGISPPTDERTDEELRALAWRNGPFTCVAVGPAGTVERWSIVVRR
ncbi:MAG: hypothetical protein H0T89_01285 [Deltaproteobacteria bacterium]|nr:hypothetical protein [Deltaproteobacteria bacterium]MDQ3298931.1 hypothetical protein [Myxococcota bacterium]